MARQPRPTSPPDEASLHEAALAHLARYGGSETTLRRVLERRILRWARQAESTEADAVAAAVAQAKRAAAAVVARLAAAGAVNDAEFATIRARRLARSGRSRRAILAHLAERGIGRALAREALPEAPEAELVAALATARRRRIGAFRASEATAETRRQDLAALSRAGFAGAIARQAVLMSAEAAEALLIGFHNG